jgi:hypothetical protein
LLGSFGELAATFDLGVRYGNSRLAPAFGIGGWWFLSGAARAEKKPEDFPTHAEWLAWKASRETSRGPFSATALALRIHWAPRLAPGLVIGLSLELFL